MSQFLLVLALGTVLPMVIGFFLVLPIPLPNSGSKTSTEPQRRTSISEVDGLIGADTPLLRGDDVDAGDVEGMDDGSVNETVVPNGNERQQQDEGGLC
jgi:hypothetical protein